MPAIAFLAREHSFSAGVVISASHNPWEDNGIKLFGPDGYKLPDATELRIEEEIYRALARTGEDVIEERAPAVNEADRAEYVLFLLAAVPGLRGIGLLRGVTLRRALRRHIPRKLLLRVRVRLLRVWPKLLLVRALLLRRRKLLARRHLARHLLVLVVVFRRIVVCVDQGADALARPLGLGDAAHADEAGVVGHVLSLRRRLLRRRLLFLRGQLRALFRLATLAQALLELWGLAELARALLLELGLVVLSLLQRLLDRLLDRQRHDAAQARLHVARHSARVADRHAAHGVVDRERAGGLSARHGALVSGERAGGQAAFVVVVRHRALYGVVCRV